MVVLPHRIASEAAPTRARAWHGETDEVERHAAIQWAGGAGGAEERQDVGGVGAAVDVVQQYDVRPNQITDWKRQLTERAVQALGDASHPASADPDRTKPPAKIGMLTLENDFPEQGLNQGGQASRRTMLDRKHKLPVPYQGALLRRTRSSAYCTPAKFRRSMGRWR